MGNTIKQTWFLINTPGKWRREINQFFMINHLEKKNTHISTTCYILILEIRICPICGGVVNKTQVAQLKTFITNPVILGNLKNSPTLINTSIYSSLHRFFYASLIRGPFHKSLAYKRYPQDVTTILASDKLTAYRARIKEHPIQLQFSGFFLPAIL